ncbi:beta carbonic anhydrase 1 [Prorops nasuta]|uniref:beta carbonic anhydrase 1 n=1 Tax=Prorops nasuta TaxID=863751 RepID=UPI0034CE02C0
MFLARPKKRGFVYCFKNIKTMDRIIKGIMMYRQCHREGMVKQFQKVRDNPEPKAVFFTCMDSRMIPTRFTETNVGDMFVVRNAGNVVPHSQHFVDELTMCEPAALELGCVVNDIRHVIVCGHSDCKAMNLLYALRDEEFASQVNRRISPLRAWLCAHAHTSLEKFQQLEITGFREPILFQAETPLRKFVAYIDPDNKFAIEDKLSQINTLQQLQNIASYGFLKKRLETHDLHIHALWFDIYTGDIYYFSRANKRFIEINELNETPLLQEIKKYYS